MLNKQKNKLHVNYLYKEVIKIVLKIKKKLFKQNLFFVFLTITNNNNKNLPPKTTGIKLYSKEF